MKLILDLLNKKKINLDGDLYKKFYHGQSPDSNSGILKDKKTFVNKISNIFVKGEKIDKSSTKIEDILVFLDKKFHISLSGFDLFLKDLSKTGYLKVTKKQIEIKEEILEDELNAILDIFFYKSQPLGRVKNKKEKIWESYANLDYLFLSDFYKVKELNYEQINLINSLNKDLESKKNKLKISKINLVDGNTIEIGHFSISKEKINLILSEKTLKEILEKYNSEIDLTELSGDEIIALNKGFNNNILSDEEYKNSICVLDEGYYDNNIRKISCDGDKKVLKEILKLGFNQFVFEEKGMNFIVLSLSSNLEEIKKLIQMKLKFSNEFLEISYPLNSRKNFPPINLNKIEILSNFFFEKNYLIEKEGDIKILINEKNNNKLDLSRVLVELDYFKKISNNKIEELTGLGINIINTKFGKIYYSGGEKEILTGKFKIEKVEKEYELLESEEKSIINKKDSEYINDNDIDENLIGIQEEIQEEIEEEVEEEIEEKEEKEEKGKDNNNLDDLLNMI